MEKNVDKDQKKVLLGKVEVAKKKEKSEMDQLEKRLFDHKVNYRTVEKLMMLHNGGHYEHGSRYDEAYFSIDALRKRMGLVGDCSNNIRLMYFDLEFERAMSWQNRNRALNQENRLNSHRIHHIETADSKKSTIKVIDQRELNGINRKEWRPGRMIIGESNVVADKNEKKNDIEKMQIKNDNNKIEKPDVNPLKIDKTVNLTKVKSALPKVATKMAVPLTKKVAVSDDTNHTINKYATDAKMTIKEDDKKVVPLKSSEKSEKSQIASKKADAKKEAVQKIVLSKKQENVKTENKNSELAQKIKPLIVKNITKVITSEELDISSSNNAIKLSERLSQSSLSEKEITNLGDSIKGQLKDLAHDQGYKIDEKQKASSLIAAIKSNAGIVGTPVPLTKEVPLVSKKQEKEIDANKVVKVSANKSSTAPSAIGDVDLKRENKIKPLVKLNVDLKPEDEVKHDPKFNASILKTDDQNLPKNDSELNADNENAKGELVTVNRAPVAPSKVQRFFFTILTSLHLTRLSTLNKRWNRRNK